MLHYQHPEFVFPLCFDDDDTSQEGDTGDSGGSADEGNEEGTGVFTQEQVNEFLAKDRRKHQEKYKALEQSMQKQLERVGNDNEERERLQRELDDLQATFRTKEQQIEWEKKQAEKKYQSDLETERKEREKWESLYKQEKIDRSLLDAASAQDAFNPTLIVDLLRPVSELKADNVEGETKLATMINFNDIDEKTGEPIKTLRTPEDAVKRMKELPQLYGGLFRANVVSGVGAGSAEATPGANSKVDLRKLTPEQYRKIRAEQPELLGLPPKRY